jgi:hypothetical protein
MNSLFTKEEGIAVQTIHVTRWKTLLNPKLHKYLDEKVERMNQYLSPAADGYDVFRGNEIDAYVVNELQLIAKRLTK